MDHGRLVLSDYCVEIQSQDHVYEDSNMTLKRWHLDRDVDI